MEFISLDIETTGLDEICCQTIEIGAIIENTHNPLPFDEIPKFHAIIKHSDYQGSAFAINMNQRIFEILANRPSDSDFDNQVMYDKKYNIVDADNVAKAFYKWCQENITNKPLNWGDPIKATVAGKNFAGFDNRFLKMLPEWNKYFQFHHRVLDPAIICWNPTIDNVLPTTEKCLERAGIENTKVSHHALEDSWQVIQILRTLYDD